MDSEITDKLESLHPDAFGWALHCCSGDFGCAEEALQNAYLKLTAGRVRFAGKSSFKTWWFGVIRLTAMEQIRRRRSHESLLGRLIASWTGVDQGDPARHVELGDEVARLRMALKRLPARQAETLHLVFYQGLTLADAAHVMGIGIGSVRQHYERGKTRLRELLGGTPPDE